MKFDLNQIINLATALAPIVQGGIVSVQHIVGAINGAVPEAAIDDDLRALIGEALAAKAEADKAATGNASNA